MRSFIFTGDQKKPMTEDEWRRAQVALAQMPSDVGSGLSAVGQALFARSHKPEFPAAPGGGGNPLLGLFRFGAKGGGGGLY